jgi:hypothetical protein
MPAWVSVRPFFELPDDGSTNFFVDLDLPDDADQLADRLVATLRDVFGVPHPTFLTVKGFGSAGRLHSEDLPFGLTVAAQEPASKECTTALPEGPDELRDLVEATLATVVEHELAYDIDGDMPIYGDSAVIYVRVEEDSPSIRVFAPFLSDVRWTPRVGSTIADVNLRARYAKVIFHDGVLFATMQLYGAPFVPEHLCHAVEGIRALVTDVVEELQETLGGETFAASSDSTGEDAASRQTPARRLLRGGQESCRPRDGSLSRPGCPYRCWRCPSRDISLRCRRVCRCLARDTTSPPCRR